MVLSRRTLLWSLLVVPMVLINIGCASSNREASPPERPLWLGVAYDVSGSVDQRELPVFTAAHLEKILATLKARGGATAFGLINEKAFKPLTRIELKRVAGRLDERAQINGDNQKAIGSFKAQVEEQIRRPRNAQRTDITGSIARFALFFGEPAIPVKAEKFLLFISDGIDTGPWRRLSDVHLPEGVKVFVVGMESGLAEKLFGKQATLSLFEGIDAAINSLHSHRDQRS